MSYIDKLYTLAKSASKAIDNNETLMVPVVFAKLKKCAEAYPHDATILGIANVFSKFSETRVLIKKGEFKDLYNKFYTTSTKFATLFEDELDAKNNRVNQVSGSKFYERNDCEGELDIHSHADSLLSTALENIFDKNASLKLYDKKLANKSKELVLNKLVTSGLKPTSLEVANGNESFIVIQANYETPKGVTSVFVPTQIVGDNIEEPEVFVGNKVFSDITHDNIKNYIKVNAGSKLTVTADLLLSTLNKTAAVNSSVNNIELAAIKVNASKNASSEFASHSIINQELDDSPVQDLIVPKAKLYSDFEAKLETEAGLADLKFGKKVAVGKDLIVRELSSFGYKSAKIEVSKVTSDKVIYAVSLNSNKVAFNVPVSMSERVEIPGVIVANGSVMDFSQESIAEIQDNNLSDFKASAISSAQYGLKPSELIANIRTSMANGNTFAAEDALNVLKQAGDEKAYATGFKAFASALSTPQEKEVSKCTLVIKTATSAHPVCGHTNLPLHKVHQDKYGNCQPLYRKNMAETYEGAYFMNSKIFG